MAKQRIKKKRNKTYQGSDASTPSKPTVRRYEAIERGPVAEWWQTKKTLIKVGGGVVLGAGFIIWMITEAVQLVI